MDTHNKRINWMNMNTFGRMSLVPDGTVEQEDSKNAIWIPFFFIYPEPEDEEVASIAMLESRLINSCLLTI